MFTMTIRVLLCVVLLVSAVVKLANLRQWKVDLKNLDLPPRLTYIGVYGVPVIELFVGVGVASAWYRSFATAAVLMFALFTMLVIRNHVRGRTADCGCFGKFWRTEEVVPLLFRNVVLISLAVFAAV